MDGVTVGRYRGDLATAAVVLGGDADNAVGGSLEVWMDPRGFFVAYNAAMELDDARYALEWRLTDIGTTVVELPG